MGRIAGTQIKQSFEQRAKRLGLIITEPDSLSSNNNNNQLLAKFRGVPFWRWNLSEAKHRELYKAGKCPCFNCKIGWAVKGYERPSPVFPAASVDLTVN